jgi:hypothetical protein
MAAMRRSTQILLLGAAVTVLGAGLVFSALVMGDDGETSAPPATTPTTIAAGTVVIPAGAPTGVPTTFTIPEGKQAVAVQLPFVAGLAGYAKAGDVVNIYATLEKGAPASTPPPLAKLVLTNVPVLAVTGPLAGSGAGNATYLLALDAVQAEQAIFLSRFESLWMTLVPQGQPPAPATSGRTYQNAF